MKLEHGKYYWVRYRDAWEQVCVWEIARYDESLDEMRFSVRTGFTIDARSSSIFIDPKPIERK